MKISDLIRELQEMQTKHGDLPVRIDSLERAWTPSLEVRQRPGGKVLILND